MDFFETPSWDTDNVREKLTNDLFRPVNVSRVKVAKKRKRNKYPRDSVSNVRSHIVDSPKEGKIAKLGEIKSLDLGKINDPQNQGLVSKGKISQKVLTHIEKGKVQPSVIQTESEQSTISLNAPVKHGKKKKKNKSPKLEGQTMKIKSDHISKSLQDKLDLNVKLDTCDNKVNEAICSDANRHELRKNTKTQMLDDSSHAVKKLRKRASINMTQNLIKGGLPKEIKNEIVTSRNKRIKIKTKGTDNISQSVMPKLKKQSLLLQNLDIQPSSSISQEDILVCDKIKKSKKKRKKGTGDGCENNNLVTEGSSPQSLESPNTTPSKKRRHADDNEIGKKIEKVCVTEADGRSNELSLQNSEAVPEQAEEFDDGASTSPKGKPTLRDKMMEKLRGSRFRFLNEQIYNSKSQETRNFFLMDQESFEAYHEGYKQQLSQWPVKPVDIIIKYLKKKPANYQIADFGCGDAKIAQSIPNQVHSFDYVALNDHVTACDMAHTPLSNGSVDIAIFCLSLMGSNLSDYIYEANRVLKIGGILKIAEVESRFDNVEKFIRVISKYGFLCISRDLSRDVFYLLDFKKEKNIKDGKSLPPIELRACSYKKR